MKNYIIIFGLSFIVSLQFCKKTPKEILPKPTPLSKDDSMRLVLQKDLNLIFLSGTQELGSASALKNGNLWIASAGSKSYISGTLAIDMSTVNEQGDLREFFGLFRVPKIIGKYPFGTHVFTNKNNVQVLYQRAYADGCVHGTIHLADPFYINQDFLEVTSVDTINRIISGKFDVHVTDSLPPTSYPYYTIAHFSDGVFSVKFQ